MARMVTGYDYVAADEEYQKKQKKKAGKEMKTAGIAKELKGAKKDQGYSKMPKVKPQKKVSKMKSKKQAY